MESLIAKNSLPSSENGNFGLCQDRFFLSKWNSIVQDYFVFSIFSRGWKGDKGNPVICEHVV